MQVFINYKNAISSSLTNFVILLLLAAIYKKMVKKKATYIKPPISVYPFTFMLIFGVDLSIHLLSFYKRCRR